MGEKGAARSLRSLAAKNRLAPPALGGCYLTDDLLRLTGDRREIRTETAVVYLVYHTLSRRISTGTPIHRLLDPPTLAFDPSGSRLGSGPRHWSLSSTLPSPETVTV